MTAPPKTPSHKSLFPQSQGTPFAASHDLGIDHDLTLELSPSKARQAAQTSHAWNVVIQWLQLICQQPTSSAENVTSQSNHVDQWNTHDNIGPGDNRQVNLPKFERNDATLAAFQSLMRTNKDADHARRVIFEAQVKDLDVRQPKTVKEYDQVEANTTTSGSGLKKLLLSDIQRSLSPRGMEALKSISSAALILGIPIPSYPSEFSSDTESISDEVVSKIIQIQHQIFTLKQQIQEIEQLSQHLSLVSIPTSTKTAMQSQHEDPNHNQPQTKTQTEFQPRNLHLINHDTEPPSHNSITPQPSVPVDISHLRAQISRYQTETRQIQHKLHEYTSKIHSLQKVLQEPNNPMKPLRDLLNESSNQQAETTRVLNNNKTLENQIRELGGLPPDITLSREEVRRAMRELEAFKQKREEIFEGL